MADKQILVALSKLEEKHKARYEEASKGSAHACDVRFLKTEDVTEADLKGIHGIIGYVPADLLHAADALEWIHLSWSGVDAFIKPGVLDESVTVCNARGAHGLAVSEHMVALTMMLVRRLYSYRDNQ